MPINFDEAMAKIGTSEVSSIAGFKALIQNMNAAAIGATDDAISLLYSGKLTNTESAWQVLDPLTKSAKVTMVPALNLVSNSQFGTSSQALQSVANLKDATVSLV